MTPLAIKNIQVLDKKVLDSPHVLSLAQFLLGKYLISRINGQECAARIVETEAYKAPEDKGSHAYQNKRTARTDVMFGPAGHAYVYLCYGIHNMLNVVTGPEGSAHAILIRAIEPLLGVDVMLDRRKCKEQQMTNGPGKLCQAMEITREHNAIDLCDKRSPIWLGVAADLVASFIIASPRVGIAYAEECAHWPWRFRVKGNVWTSPPHKVSYSSAEI